MDQNVVTPVLTVLMPVYNASVFLQDAIQSVLNQTFIEYEFIIINDGSSDDSEMIIQRFQDGRIRYVKNEVNLKLIKTLNLGLSLAKGKYVARIDADDICLPNRFEKQIAFLENHPEIGVLGSYASIIDEYNQQIGECIYPTEHDGIALDLVRYNPMIHPSVMLRSSILKEESLFFDERFVHAEDYELWTRLISKTKFANLPEKLLLYRKHSSQISSVHTSEQLILNKQISINYLKQIGWKNMDAITWYFSLIENNNYTFEDGLMFYQFIYNENRNQKLFSSKIFENQLKNRFLNYCLGHKTMTLKNYKLVRKMMEIFFIELTNKQKISLILKLVRN